MATKSTTPDDPDAPVPAEDPTAPDAAAAEDAPAAEDAEPAEGELSGVADAIPANFEDLAALQEEEPVDPEPKDDGSGDDSGGEQPAD